MPYGVIYDIPAPVQMYDAVHTALLGEYRDTVPGLLAHIGRATDGGFQVIEVWESESEAAEFNENVLGPLIGKMYPGQAPPSDDTRQEFDPRGLVIPSRNLAL
jgi:hypothetical protein